MGIVRNKTTKRVLQGCIASGYRSVKFTFENSKQKRFYVHRLVAEAFCENDKPSLRDMVNHKDGDKLNNVASNLEWVSARENNLHYYRTDKGRRKAQKQTNQLPKPISQFTITGELVAHYPSFSEASRQTGISVAHISRAVYGEAESAGSFLWKLQ